MANLNFGPKNHQETVDFAVEELRASLQYGILKAMNEEGISQAKLSRMVGCSPAAISQFLDDDANLTVESVAKLLLALGRRCEVSFPAIGNLADREQSVEPASPKHWLREPMPKEAWGRPLVDTATLIEALRHRAGNGSVEWGANDNYSSPDIEKIA